MKYIWLDLTLPYIVLFVFIIPVSSDGGWGVGGGGGGVRWELLEAGADNSIQAVSAV